MMSLSLALGGLIGLILALTGAGGAILAVPLLLFVMHLSVVEAAPVALLAVALSSGVGAVIGLRAGIVRYKAAALMALSGMLISPAGLWMAHQIPNQPLVFIFAVVLIYVSVRMFRQAVAGGDVIALKQTPPCQLDPVTGKFRWTAPCARALMVSGSVAGFLSGLLGVGGGFVIVPALKRATDAPMQAIVATSLAVITLVSAFGVSTAVVAGHMNWAIAVPFASGAMLGMVLGQLVARQLAGHQLQRGFAVVSACVAVGMIAKAVF